MSRKCFVAVLIGLAVLVVSSNPIQAKMIKKVEGFDDIFADFRNLGRYLVFALLGKSSVRSAGLVGQFLDEGDEVLISRNEISLAVDFDEG